MCVLNQFHRAIYYLVVRLRNWKTFHAWLPVDIAHSAETRHQSNKQRDSTPRCQVENVIHYGLLLQMYYPLPYIQFMLAISILLTEPMVITNVIWYLISTYPRTNNTHNLFRIVHDVNYYGSRISNDKTRPVI